MYELKVWAYILLFPPCLLAEFLILRGIYRLIHKSLRSNPAGKETK